MIVVDHPFDPVPQHHDVKIDQEADTHIQPTKEREQWSLINGMKRVFALGLDYDSAFHDQARSKAAIEFYVLVDQWDWFLALHLHT